MGLESTAGQVLNSSYDVLNTFVSYLNMILTNAFGPAAPYVVAILAFIGGWFLQKTIAKNQTSHALYIVISLLIFLSVRYLGLGG